jgi:hypothetical protein
MDIAGLCEALKAGETDLITHAIGSMVRYAFAETVRALRTPFMPDTFCDSRTIARCPGLLHNHA